MHNFVLLHKSKEINVKTLSGAKDCRHFRVIWSFLMSAMQLFLINDDRIVSALGWLRFFGSSHCLFEMEVDSPFLHMLVTVNNLCC